MNFMKEDSVRVNMVDMLTYKDIHAKKELKKDLESKIVQSPTQHQEM